jgi:hypothetical protein
MLYNIHCKRQTRPLVREGIHINKPATVRKKKIFPKWVLDIKNVGRNMTSTLTWLTVELRVQLWSVNQRATVRKNLSIAKIRYQETYSEDTAEE